MRIGNILRRWRINTDRSLRSLASDIGVSAATLSRLETGENVDGATVGKVLCWLFGDDCGRPAREDGGGSGGRKEGGGTS